MGEAKVIKIGTAVEREGVPQETRKKKSVKVQTVGEKSAAKPKEG
jgi:hypothetical protein